MAKDEGAMALRISEAAVKGLVVAVGRELDRARELQSK
jgi:hypothetical protein